jgi:hypothetical protein
MDNKALRNKFKKIAATKTDLVRFIDLTVFNKRLWVLLADKELIPDQKDGMYMWNTGEDLRLILLDRNLDHTADRYNLIAHESFHATKEILTNMGVELCEGSEEIFAYTMGHITSSVIDTILDEDYFPTKDDIESTLNILEFIDDFNKKEKELLV